jgi:hypothetical protein
MSAWPESPGNFQMISERGVEIWQLKMMRGLPYVAYQQDRESATATFQFYLQEKGQQPLLEVLGDVMHASQPKKVSALRQLQELA